MQFNKKMLGIVLLSTLIISMGIPMIYAPRDRREGFGDPVGWRPTPGKETPGLDPDDTDGSEVLCECSPKEADEMIETILADDHGLDDDYDNFPEIFLDLTSMVRKDKRYLYDLKKLVADYLGGKL